MRDHYYLQTEEKKKPELWTKQRWLHNPVDVKKKSRYRVKESPHVPELELAKKVGNLKRAFSFCWKNVNKKNKK